MPGPTRAQLRLVDYPLRDMTVATLQDEKDFVLFQFAPLPVNQRSGKYYIYPSATWNKRHMQERGASMESLGGTYTLSSDSYACKREATHIDFDWDDLSDADEQVDPRDDAAAWLANQILMQGDYLVSQEVFVDTTVWTTNWDGVSSGPSTNQVLQWDNSSSDPQSDVQSGSEVIRQLTGKRANTVIIGGDAHVQLVTNPQFRDAVKYTSETTIEKMRSMIAAYLGVEYYFVGGGFANSAAEAQTASLDQLIDPEDAWLGYVDPNPGKRSLSAFKLFAWNGGNDPQTTRDTRGVLTRRIELEEKTTTRFEVEWNVDLKVISADCGLFIKDLVA